MSHSKPSEPLPFAHSCEAFAARLDAWFDLEESQRAALRREARRCTDCGLALEAQEALQLLVREASAELSGETALPPEDVAADVGSEPSRPRWQFALAWAAAALGAVALAFVWVAQVDRHPGARTAPARSAQSVPPSLVERGPVSNAPSSEPAADVGVSEPLRPRVEVARAAPELPGPAATSTVRVRLPSASAASAAVRSVKRPHLQAMRPSGGRMSFRVPSAPSRPTSASGR